MVEGYNGSSWVTIDHFVGNIPTTGTTTSYSASTSPALPANLVQFRFTYYKGNGNLAFDDVSYTYGGTTLEPIDNSPFTGITTTSYEVTGLMPSTDYVYTVVANTATVTSPQSNAIDVTTKAIDIINIVNSTSWKVTPISAGTMNLYKSVSGAWEADDNASASGNTITVTDAVDRPCEQLKYELVDGSNQLLTEGFLRIPKYVSGTTDINTAAGSLGDDICRECDIAVLSGATLSSRSGTNQQFKNAFVLPGGKLDLIAGTAWNINDLFIKADNTGNLYNSFASAAVKLGCNFAPQGKIKYVRKIDDTRYYFISFPYAVNVSDIKAMNGSLGTLDTDWYLQSWNGARRAQSRAASGNWDRISSTSTVLTPYEGYVIGLADGQSESEVVFPLAVSNLQSDNAVNIALSGHQNSDGVSSPYHDNWNVVGQPYLCKNTGAGCGQTLVVPVDGVHNVFTYLTVPTTAINPFISYFVQTVNTGSTATFSTGGIAFVPSAVADLRSDIRIHYQSATGADYMNLILDDNESEDYNFGVDLVKWIGTGTGIPQIYMSQGGNSLAINAVDYASAINIPVTVYNLTAGPATFSADREGAGSQLTALLLTDTHTGAVTNLLFDDYVYQATAGTEATRFVLSAQRMPTGTTQTIGSDVVVTAADGTLRIEHLTFGTTIRIFDTLGRAVSTQSAAADVMEINNLPKGIYIIQTSNEQQTREYKILL